MRVQAANPCQYRWIQRVWTEISRVGIQTRTPHQGLLTSVNFLSTVSAHKHTIWHYFRSLTSRALSSSDEILQSTYAHAKLLLKTILKPKDFELLFPPFNTPGAQGLSNHTISDVQRYLNDAQASYGNRLGRAHDPFQAVAPATAIPLMTAPTSPLAKVTAKARTWLAETSEVLVHYGYIFDVMMQHHPEYASLAWGTFKLLFIVSVPHL